MNLFTMRLRFSLTKLFKIKVKLGVTYVNKCFLSLKMVHCFDTEIFLKIKANN